MDACFEVLIEQFRPGRNLLRQRHVAHWGGEEHVQRPDSFLWGEHVELNPQSDPIPEFVLLRLPPDLRQRQWERIQITGNMLDYLAYEATGGEIDWGDHSPEQLVAEMLDDRQSWIAVYLWHWDQLDEVVELDSRELVRKLRADFANVPRGFIGVHRGNSA